MEEGITLDSETKRFIKNHKEVGMVKASQVEAVEPEEPEELTGPEPGSEAEKIDKLLDQNYSAKQLREMGFASSTIRKRLHKRAKRQGLPPPENGGDNGKPGVALTIKEKEQVLPEWLEGQVAELYDGDDKTRKVFMAGMSIPLLGMRLFAESFKPMLELMRVDQARQAEAAKVAAGGSEEIARQTVAEAIPYFERIAKDAALASSPNPLQTMMAQAMSPMLTQAMSGMMGMFQPKNPQPGLKQPFTPQQPKQSEASAAEVEEAFKNG